MLLVALSLAHAGDLDLHFQVDERVHTLTLTDVASCAPTRVELDGEDSWSVRAMATAIDEAGTVYVTVDLEAHLASGREARTVRTSPAFLGRAGEPATLTVGGEAGDVVVEVVATGFDLDTRCGPSTHVRTRSEGQRHRHREIH